MRNFTFVIGYIFLAISSDVNGAFLQPPPEVRVAKSEVIAIIEVLDSNTGKEQSKVKIIQYLKGEMDVREITVWGEMSDFGGEEAEFVGRNPWLQAGEKYLIFLRRNQNGRFITTISSNCCRKFKGDMLEPHYGRELGIARSEIDKVKVIIERQKTEHVDDGKLDPFTR